MSGGGSLLYRLGGLEVVEHVHECFAVGLDGGCRADKTDENGRWLGVDHGCDEDVIGLERWRAGALVFAAEFNQADGEVIGLECFNDSWIDVIALLIAEHRFPPGDLAVERAADFVKHGHPGLVGPVTPRNDVLSCGEIRVCRRMPDPCCGFGSGQAEEARSCGALRRRDD